jgi:ubiquitin carboxyl-terminal hydrolase 16/45
MLHAQPRAVQFRSYRQQDAQELLRYLLDGVRTEEIARLAPPATTKTKTKAEQSSTPKASPPATFIDDLFGGVLESTVTCHDCHSVPALSRCTVRLYGMGQQRW